MSELDEIEAITLGEYPNDDELLGLLVLALVHNEADRNDNHFIAIGAMRLLREKKAREASARNATKETLVARTFDIEHEGKMHQLVVLRDEVDEESAIVCYARSQGKVSIKTAFKYGEKEDLRDEMFHGRSDDDWREWGQRIIAQAESMTIYPKGDSNE